MTAKIVVTCIPESGAWRLDIDSSEQNAILLARDDLIETITGDNTYKKITMGPGDLILLRNMLNAMPWP